MQGRLVCKMSSEPNVIYLGNKPPMNYVMAVITGFNTSGTTDVTLRPGVALLAQQLTSQKSCATDSSRMITPKEGATQETSQSWKSPSRRSNHTETLKTAYLILLFSGGTEDER